MNKLHYRRLSLVFVCMFGISIAISLILYALRQNINIFMTPNQLASTHITPDYMIRLGGMVKEGTVRRDNKNLYVEFVVTDFKKDLPVHYAGVLPDLFREGKGIIAEGHLDSRGTFVASQILAKHDENYMPKNIYNAMRQGKQ